MEVVEPRSKLKRTTTSATSAVWRNVDEEATSRLGMEDTCNQDVPYACLVKAAPSVILWVNLFDWECFGDLEGTYGVCVGVGQSRLARWNAIIQNIRTKDVRSETY